MPSSASVLSFWQACLEKRQQEAALEIIPETAGKRAERERPGERSRVVLFAGQTVDTLQASDVQSAHAPRK